jgi:hypothetical protein
MNTNDQTAKPKTDSNGKKDNFNERETNHLQLKSKVFFSFG